jgi:ComF family protein
MIKSPLETLINVLTIEKCSICNQPDKVLCASCFYTHFGELDYRCYICNKLTTQGRVCKSCKSSSKLRRVWWLGNYSGVLKDLVWNVKYQRQRKTARLLGRYLAETLPYLPSETVVAPLPTASSRIRKRGYDQAVILAKSFAEHKDLEFKELLVRKDQKELVGKRRVDRMKLMSESFRVKPGSDISGKSIILIDDVLTTGASLESAAKILRKNGAKHVDAAVITRHLLN